MVDPRQPESRPTPGKTIDDRAIERERMAILASFASKWGHDLNNLLFPLEAAVESLERVRGDDERAKTIARIRTVLEHLGKHSRSLRAWGRTVRDGREQFTSVADWIPALETRLREDLGVDEEAKRRCRLEIDAPESPLRISADPELLTQLVRMVVRNAREAMPDGGTVRLQIERSPEDWRADAGGASGVRITVTDTGIGMPPEVLERACEAFFSQRGGPAEGLGLTMVSGAMHSLGGSIQLQSTQGLGTTIILDLPGPAGRETASPSAKPGKRALVSLSDPRIAAFVSHSLGRAGWPTRIDAQALPADDDGLWLVEASTVDREAIERTWGRRPGLRIIAIGGERRGEPLPEGVQLVKEPVDMQRLERILLGHSPPLSR